jgi:hypothetical protein
MYSEDNKRWADDQPHCSEPQEQALDGGIADLEIILRVSQHENHSHSCRLEAVQCQSGES